MVIFKNLTNVKFQQLKNSIGKEKLRPSLNGVFLDIEEDKIVVTNGQILFAFPIEIEFIDEVGEMRDIIIDAKIFNQNAWLSVPKDDLELVVFHVTKELTQVVLGGEIVAVSKNIEHEKPFPQWKWILKNEEKFANVSVDSSLMKSAMSCFPSGFQSPTIEFGKKVLFSSSGFDIQDNKIEILGVLMPLSFDEVKVFNQSEKVVVNSETRFEDYLGREVSKRIVKTWNEEFVDEDNGEAVSIERNEIVCLDGIIVTEEIVELLKESEIKEFFILKQR